MSHQNRPAGPYGPGSAGYSQQHQPGYRPGPGASTPQDTTDRTLSILAHLSAPIAALVSAGWLSLVGPLLVYLFRKDDPRVRAAAAGAFNFNVAFWLLYVISWLLILTLVGAVIGVPLMLIGFVVSAWCHLKGAIRAAQDRPYEYPFQIRILR